MTINSLISSLKKFLVGFRLLRWKLALSYMLTTIFAFLVFQFVAVLLIINFIIGQYPQTAVDSLRQEAPSLLPYFKKAPTNVTELQGELANVEDELQVAYAYTDQNTGVTAIIPLEKGGYIIAVDQHGLVQASTNPQEIPEERRLENILPVEGINVYHAAQAGSVDVNQITVLTPHRVLYVAVPIFVGKKVVGVLISRQTLPTQAKVMIALFPLLLPMLLLMTSIAGVVGILFGLIMSRWFTKRFKKVIRATEGWSKGDFSLMAYDRSADELGQLARQLNAMAKKLEQLLEERQNIAVLDERNRLARDLHDSLKQQIFAITMQVWSAQAFLETNTEIAKDRLVAIEHLLSQAQQELSSLIYQLRPIALEDKPFVDALRDYCERWSYQQHTSIDLDIEVEHVDLSLKTEEALFRIVQESLTNIARHSEATSVQVRLTGEEDRVVLSIQDNGRGFNKERLNGHGIGLLSMRERIEALGGSLSITSSRGEGTTIIASYTRGRTSGLLIATPSPA